MHNKCYYCIQRFLLFILRNRGHCSARKGRKVPQLWFIQWKEPITKASPGYHAMEELFRMFPKIVTILFSGTDSSELRVFLIILLKLLVSPRLLLHPSRLQHRKQTDGKTLAPHCSQSTIYLSRMIQLQLSGPRHKTVHAGYFHVSWRHLHWPLVITSRWSL